MLKNKLALALTAAIAGLVTFNEVQLAQSADPLARDPGVRQGTAGAGAPLNLLTVRELEYFKAAKDDFEEVEEVKDGLGPTMNLDSCGGCHSQPSIGGTRPLVNPQVEFANKLGAPNRLPAFIRREGPLREARLLRNAHGSPAGGAAALLTSAR